VRGYKNIEANPRPGDLKDLIEIVRTSSTTNANGYAVTTDTVVCTVWAAAIDGAAQFQRAADTMIAQPKIKFVMRYRSDVSAGMWVKFREQKYLIESVGAYAFGRTYMILTTSDAKGVGQ
jgi:SPP1 family predicted phage head-tail adaptor